MEIATKERYGSAKSKPHHTWEGLVNVVAAPIKPCATTVGTCHRRFPRSMDVDLVHQDPKGGIPREAQEVGNAAEISIWPCQSALAMHQTDYR